MTGLIDLQVADGIGEPNGLGHSSRGQRPRTTCANFPRPEGATQPHTPGKEDHPRGATMATTAEVGMETRTILAAQGWLPPGRSGGRRSDSPTCVRTTVDGAESEKVKNRPGTGPLPDFLSFGFVVMPFSRPCIRVHSSLPPVTEGFRGLSRAYRFAEV